MNKSNNINELELTIIQTLEASLETMEGVSAIKMSNGLSEELHLETGYESQGITKLKNDIIIISKYQLKIIVFLYMLLTIRTIKCEQNWGWELTTNQSAILIPTCQFNPDYNCTPLCRNVSNCPISCICTYNWYKKTYINTDTFGWKSTTMGSMEGGDRRRSASHNNNHDIIIPYQATIQLDGHNVLMQQNQVVEGYLLECQKDSFRKILFTNTLVVNLNVDQSCFITSGNLVCSIIRSNDSVAIMSKYFQITGMTYCPIPDCLLCSQVFSTFYCAPPTMKIMSIILIIIIILLGLIALPIIWILIKTICLFSLTLCRCCCYLGKKPLRKMKNNIYTKNIYNKFQQVKNGKFDDESSTEIIEDIPKEEKIDMEDSPRIKTKSRFISPMNIILKICMISLILAPIESCNINQALSSSQISCLNYADSGVPTCLINTTIDVNFQNVGDELCVTMTDQNGIQQGTVKVTYVQQIHKLIQNLAYYTSDLDIMTYSALACAWTDNCHLEPIPAPGVGYRSVCNVCNSPGCGIWNPNDYPVNYPGLQFCTQTGCSCACSNCFACEPGCVYGMLRYIPKAPYMSVSSINGLLNNPTIRITVLDSFGNEVSTKSIEQQTTAGTIKNGNYQYTINGGLNGQSNFYQDKIIFNGSSYFYYVANDLNQAIAGSIGDIQGSSPSTMNSGSGGTFIVPNNFVPYTTNLQGVQWNVPLTGYSANKIPMNLKKLPLNINNGIMSVAAGETSPTVKYISGNYPMSSTLTLNNVKINLLVNQACPSNLVIVNDTSCVNCDAYSKITFSVINKCLTGSTLVYFKDISIGMVTPSLIITSSLTPISYNASFIIGKNFSETQFCVSSGSEICLPYTIRAIEIINIRNDSVNITTNDTKLEGTLDRFLSSIFDPVTSLFKFDSAIQPIANIIASIITIVLIIAGIIVIIIIVRILVKKINSSKINKESYEKID